MSDKPTVEQLEELSAKATQGDFTAIVHNETPLAHVVRDSKPVCDIYGGADTTQEERFANAHFIAALVNWWRYGGAELVRKAQAMDRALTWLHNANEDVRDGKINYRPDDHIAVIDAARKDMSAERKGERG